MGGEGNSRTSSEIVDTTTRLRLVSERQGAEHLQSRDRSRRGDDGYDDRHSGNRRGSDVPNSGSGSFNSGPGNSSDGRRGGDGSRGILPRDVRQEDRREDRHLDRRDNRQEDRRLDHRENRVANSGGELRGLDRAKHVADDHGQGAERMPAPFSLSGEVVLSASSGRNVRAGTNGHHRGECIPP